MDILNYIDEGSGTPVIFLHGFGENRLIWQGFQQALSNHYRIISPDLRGFGLSDLSSEGMSITSMADDVKNLLDHLHISKCIMIGHSMGGYISMAFAEKYPEMLLGLGMFHSSAFPDSEEKQRSRNHTIEYLQSNGVEAFATNFVKNLFYHKNRKALEKEMEQTIAMVNGTTLEGMVNATKAMRDRKDRSEVLKSLQIPVLFIVGKEDGAVPLDTALQQVHLPEYSHTVFLAGVAHMGMFEAREKTLEAVRSFLGILT